jgi:hypothetical protein
MSLSFPDRPRRADLHGGLLVVTVIAGALCAIPAQAAQTYWQPEVEVSVEQHTNRNLAINPDLEQDIHGYALSAGILWGYVTPTSDTRLFPRVRVQNFPDDDDAERTEQYFDFSTWHQPSERTTWDLVGRYAREDATRTELGGAEFDDFDPDDPTDGAGTGVVTGDEARTRAQLRPRYTHRFSELTGIAIGGLAETVRYSSDFANRTEFDYYELRTQVTRQHTERTRFAGGPVVSRYETRDDLNTTDDYGVELAMEHQWSEVQRFGGGLWVRRSEVEVWQGTFLLSETQTNYGFDLNWMYRTELGRLRANAGRTLRPSSSGNMVTQDQLRVQYDHDFSERLSMRTAVRAYTRESVGSFGTGNSDRDYARGELGLTWMLTPTMFVSGRYEYTWSDIASDGTSAKNHAAIVSFGYRGLGRPE